MYRPASVAPLLTLMVCLSTSASGAGIYKWVDKNGKTHFGDRPPVHAAQSQEVKIRDIPQADRQVPSDAERRARQNLLLESFERQRAEKKQAAAEEKERRQKLARQCVRARHNLQQMQSSSYLYDLDDSGQKVIRSDKDREQTTRELEQAIAKNCS